MKVLSRAILLFLLTTLRAQVTPVRMPEDVAIFAIQRHENSLSINPVVIVHYGRDQQFKTVPSLNAPLPSTTTDDDFGNFEKSFYVPGRPLSLFSGGKKVGTAKIVGSNIEGREGDCVDLSATISYGGPAKPLLAANTGSEIPGHASTRRSATPQEVSILYRLTNQWLFDYGLDHQLVRQGHIGQVVSTDLRKSVGRAIIGRLDVTSKRAIFRLFAVAEKEHGRYRLTLTNLEIQNDLEDGTDKTEREYVDQLDINNDATDEIITSSTYYESWDYSVWKFDSKQNAWRRAFTGSGEGC